MSRSSSSTPIARQKRYLELEHELEDQSPRTMQFNSEIEKINDIIIKHTKTYNEKLEDYKKKYLNNVDKNDERLMELKKKHTNLLLNIKRDLTTFKLRKNHMEILLYETKLKENKNKKDYINRSVWSAKQTYIQQSLNNLKQHNNDILNEYETYLKNQYGPRGKNEFKNFKDRVETEIHDILNYSKKSESRIPRSSNKHSKPMSTKSFSRTSVPQNTTVQSNSPQRTKKYYNHSNSGLFIRRRIDQSLGEPRHDPPWRSKVWLNKNPYIITNKKKRKRQIKHSKRHKKYPKPTKKKRKNNNK